MPYSRSWSLHRPVACYSELPRIPIPRTSVNKEQKKGRSPVRGRLVQRGASVRMSHLRRFVFLSSGCQEHPYDCHQEQRAA